MKAGFTYLQQTDMAASNTIAFGGQELVTHDDMKVDLKMSVKDLDGGRKEIGITIMRFVVDYSEMGATETVLHYDSEGKVKDPELIVYDDLVGTTKMVSCTLHMVERKTKDNHSFINPSHSSFSF